jgi:6-phosphogluconolactonase
MYAYVGSRTSRERKARGEGISVFKLDQETGKLDLVQVVGDLVNPSFLALNRRGDVLYTVHGDQDYISAFRVNPSDGRLTFLNRQSCQGRNPVHLALDLSERFLVVSNHLSGTLAVMPVALDGSLEEVSQLVSMTGTPGPHRTEQPFAKPHFNPFDASGTFVLVPDKGLDRVFSFRFDKGTLSPASTPWMDSREGAGPRHLAFHPAQDFVYVVNELDSTVTSCRFDSATGALAAFQVQTTLPDTHVGNSRASEIAVDAAGRTLYVSNRGFDSIAIFAIDPGTGRLRMQDVVPVGGRTPRFFSLSPNGCWLFVLNEDSDNIVAFGVDSKNGLLKPTPQTTTCASPVCLVWRVHTAHQG